MAEAGLLIINNPAIEISLKLQIKNNNIVVHINSKDINWEIIRIQPNIEYLLLPENADKIMNIIDKPEIIINKTRESIKLIKKKGYRILYIIIENKKKNIGKD